MVQSDLFNNTELSETEIDLMKSFLSDIKRKKVKVTITNLLQHFLHCLMLSFQVIQPKSPICTTRIFHRPVKHEFVIINIETIIFSMQRSHNAIKIFTVKGTIHFLYKAPSLNLGKKLGYLLSNREGLN